MIIKIEKTSRQALEKGCALAGMKVSFYSNETAEQMLVAEITDEFGEEPSNVMGFYLARHLEVEIQCEEFAKRK